ncbi:MAG: MOSC domain-containing protein [Arcicella sp.]|nr:MOSC domain-containing protein [Arcicella sp.]
MLQLSEIYVYPVKSLGGVRLESAEVTDRGLQYDRRWMLVDENNRFISQREYPQLALFRVQLYSDYMVITDLKRNWELMNKLNRNISEFLGKITVTVWDDEVEAYEVSETCNKFFTEGLGRTVRLVYMKDENIRKTDTQYSLKGDEITSFSDGYPVLVIGQSSLNDLNSKLDEPVNIDRFRPNFVFTGGNEFEEEEWHEFTVGDVRFFGVKPCARCTMTTIDPQTGEKKGKEPLLTLNKYRKAGSKILFGQNVLISQLGTVSVGDEIEVISRKKLAKFEVD